MAMTKKECEIARMHSELQTAYFEKISAAVTDIVRATMHKQQATEILLRMDSGSEYSCEAAENDVDWALNNIGNDLLRLGRGSDNNA